MMKEDMSTRVYITLPYLFQKSSDEARNGVVISDQLMNKKYSVSSNYVEMLRDACEARLYQELASIYGKELANMAILYKHVLAKERLWEYSNVTQASIEINTECNWKCRYCPNHISPYPSKRMKTSLFREILKK